MQSGIISTINGTNYASATVNTDPSSSAAASTVSNYVYDNVYSGAAIIRGHQGNNVFIDNITVGDSESFYLGSGSNLVYATSNELASLHIYTASYSGENILRVEGWGATVTSGNAFNIGGSDPFTGTLINATVATGGVANYGFNVLDVRTGTDTVTATTTTIAFGTTTNTVHPTFNLSGSDILYITGASTTAPTANQTLSLKLDSGELFTPTGTVGAPVTSGNTISYYSSASVHNASTLIATDVHNAANYYSDVFTYASVNSHTITLNVHYGAG